MSSAPPPGPEGETLPSAEPTGEDVLQSVVERLMEDEALTADLVDAAARQLLDWGIAQTERILRETGPASEESRARLAELRGQMREIARRVGQLPPEEQPGALQAALENRSQSAVRSPQSTVRSPQSLKNHEGQEGGSHSDR